MVHHSGETGRPTVGIVLVILATLVFASADTVTKHLALNYPVPVVMAIRYFVNVVLLFALLWPRTRARLWQANRKWLALLRALCLAVASFSVALALQRMPVGETVAIVYLAPFAVLLLSAPLLGERVSSLGWVGVAFGFVGVLLIARPGGSLDPLGVAFALVNAAFTTVYYLLTRLLSRTETTVSLLFHTAWVGAVIFGVFAIPSLGDFSPTPIDAGLMLLLGAMMTLGHYLFTAAFREAPPALLAPINYLHLAWAGLLGWLVYGHVPEQLSVVGMVLVIAAGAVVAVGAHVQRIRTAAPGA